MAETVAVESKRIARDRSGSQGKGKAQGTMGIEM
jgi:hypothetical protein